MMAVFDLGQRPPARADTVDPVALVQRYCIFAVFSQGPAFGCLDPGYRLALAEDLGADASRRIVEAGLASSLFEEREKARCGRDPDCSSTLIRTKHASFSRLSQTRMEPFRVGRCRTRTRSALTG